MFKDLLRRTQFLCSETQPEQLRPSLAEVAFVGRSNSGKSSLLNALCEQKGLADVSKEPGRTRKLNIYAAAHGRWLVDMPGYGFAFGPSEERTEWLGMIQKYLTSRPKLQAIVLMFDSEVGPKKTDLEMRDWIAAQGLPYFWVGNKVDRIPAKLLETKQKNIAAQLKIPIEEIRWVSVTHGAGVKSLRKTVIELLSR